MAIKFLRVSPEEAVEAVRDCISGGWKLREKLLEEYYSIDTESRSHNLDKWNQDSKKWIDKTYKRLKKIYFSNVEPENFRNHRATFAEIGMSFDYGNIVIRLEGKIDSLNQLYIFIFQHSNILINAKGDVMFQYGDNSKIEVKNG